MYWLPKLPKSSYKARFIANSSSCTTTDFSTLLEKVPQDLFHSVYFEYEENCTHDRLLSLNYAFCHIKSLIKTSEPVYVDQTVHRKQFNLSIVDTPCQKAVNI